MKRLLGILLAALMMMSFNTAYSFEGPKADQKMSQELLDAIEPLGPNDTIDVYAILYDVDYDEVMRVFEQGYPDEYSEYCIAKESDIGYAQRLLAEEDPNYDDSKYEDPINGSLLQQAIETKRMLFAEAYLAVNNEFIARNNVSEVLFVSRYAPMMILSVSKDELYSLEKDNDVFSLDLFVDMVVEEELYLANNMSGASYLRDTLGYAGDEVKIGQIEPGLPNVNHSDLSAANITCNITTSSYTDHATRVARILVGQSNGIAPDAELYSATTTNTISFYEAVEWLIDQGVNIINMSAGLNLPQGSDTAVPHGLYETGCKWVDHIAVQHDVHFVKSAGNRGKTENNPDGDSYITCPGMAYNVITVGGFNDKNNSVASDDEISDFSSYLEKSTYNRPEKPNLVAAATNIYIGSNDSGTSFAAPQVAGVIAQLCSYSSALKTRQTIVGAMLAASSTCKVTGTNPGNTNGIFNSYAVNEQISKKEGAGKLNATAARTVVKNGKYWKETINTSSFPYTKTVYISSTNNTLMRVAIFWLKRNSLSSSDHTVLNVTQIGFSNLNVTVYAPDGTVMGTSATAYSNYEIVQFEPTQTGTYRIVISKANTNASTKEFVGIAVW
jgi:hypothetical protein